MSNVILVGKEKRTTKTGDTAYILHFNEIFNDHNGNSEGSRAFSEYIKGDFSRLGIGEPVSLVYRKGFQDKAFLADVS